MNESLAELGAPENLIQLLAAPSYERTQVLMREVDTVIATGGAKMVKAAYSSGTPAFGVGPGNVQVIFDDAIDYCVAARAVVTGKTFDNGIICSSEQFVHFPSKDEARVLKSFTDAGAFLIDNPDLILKLEKALFPGGIQNKALIGRSVSVIAEAASISIPPTTRVLMVRARPGDQDPFRREKMFPVLSYESYNTLIEAIESANRNLRLEGMGHTCVVHSNSNLMIEQVALELYVSRIVVNQPGSLSAGGNFRNGLAPSTTLGCGSWGHNSISVNLDYHHLLNIQKIAIPVERRVPKSEEIWTLVESSLED
jgi:succinate-semialdehyde dehydrogenase